MPRIKLYLLNIKKEFLELLNNRAVLFLWGLAFIILLFFPFIDKKFFDNSSNLTSQSMLYYVQIISIILLGQFIFDGCKKDFSKGGGIFLLNVKSTCKAYLFGKRVVSSVLLIFLYSSRFSSLSEVITCKSILFLILFYIFVINNALIFSLLFYTSNTSFFAFILINFIPLFFFFLLNFINLYFIRFVILILLNIVLQKNLIKIYWSKWFRKNLK